MMQILCSALMALSCSIKVSVRWCRISVFSKAMGFPFEMNWWQIKDSWFSLVGS